MITGQSSEIDAFWHAACEARSIAKTASHHATTFADHRFAPEADGLVELARSGQKRGTTHLQLDFDVNGVALRKTGDYWIIINSALEPRCLVRLTKVEIKPFNQVDEDYAASEGEGDLSLAYWRRVHSEYYQLQCAQWGREWHENLPVVCENFELVWAG